MALFQERSTLGRLQKRGKKKMIRKIVAGALGLIAVSLVLTAHAQKNTSGVEDREREHRSLAVNMARAINTAEAGYKKAHGVFATWDTFISNGDFSDTGTKWAPESLPAVAHAMYGRGPEIVPGWKLRLNLSKDATAYDLVLEDVTDPKCRYAVFSDERGLIRQGRAIDCSP
jgi:hypothetical protein